MNAKESAKLRRLELENFELRVRNDKHIRVYGDMCVELIELRAKLELLKEIINDAS
jgi:hypothetical protein